MVVDSIDSNDNVYDVYYDVHEHDDTDLGVPGVANPLGGGRSFRRRRPGRLAYGKPWPIWTR